MEQQSDQSIFDMSMDSNTQDHLQTISKWTRFISITGFILVGLVLLTFAIIGASVADRLSVLFSLQDTGAAGIAIVVILVMFLFVGFWLYFLYRSSSLLKQGLQSRDAAILADGFKAMKTYFIFSFIISILTIVSALQSLV